MSVDTISNPHTHPHQPQMASPCSNSCHNGVFAEGGPPGPKALQEFHEQLAEVWQKPQAQEQARGQQSSSTHSSS